MEVFMNFLSKFTSAVLAASLCAVPLTCFAAAPAEQTDTAVSPYYEAAVIAPDGVTVSRNIILDYPQGIITMDYTFENTGSEEADCFLGIPVESSLSAEHLGMYEFLSDADGEAFGYFTPLFSSSDELSAETVTADLLYSCRDLTASLPDDDGVFYTITLDSALEESLPVLTVTTLTDDACRIYPIGCTYTGKEGVYNISAAKQQTECYVFITGEEGTDFSLEVTAGDSTSITDSISTLDSFMELGCRLFLDANPMHEPVDKELLMQHLAVYLDGSTVSVSLDLLPSLQWLVKQKLFEVYAYEMTVPQGESVTVSIVKKQPLPVNGLSFNPILTNSQKKLASNTFEIIFPNEYTRASVRLAKGSFDKETSTLTLKKAEKVYQINLAKTPVWVKAHDYIVPMTVVMLIFLTLCFVSYAARKKPQTPKE